MAIVRFDYDKHRESDGDAEHEDTTCVVVFGNRTLGFVNTEEEVDYSNPEKEQITFLVEEDLEEDEMQKLLVMQVDMPFAFTLIKQAFDALHNEDTLEMVIDTGTEETETWLF